MSSTSPAWGYAQTFRSRKPVSTTVMACLTAVMGLAALGAAEDVNKDGAAGVFLLALMAVICGYGTLQLIRGRVSVTAAGVTVRGAFRSRRYDAAEVDHVGVGPSRNGRMAVLWLRSGKRVRLQALSASGTRAATARLNSQVEEINRMLLKTTSYAADGSPPSLRIGATRARDRRRARGVLIVISGFYIAVAIAAAVVIRTPAIDVSVGVAVVLEAGVLWRVFGSTRGPGRSVPWMLAGLALSGGAARIAVALSGRSAPQFTAPAGFATGTAQRPTSGLWKLSGTITSSAGYANSEPGTQIHEYIGIQRRCTRSCHYLLTRVFENPANANQSATATLTHQANGWQARWPGQISQCGGTSSAPVMWTGHELWTMRFINHGHGMQANGHSLSYDKRCGYGQDSIAWTAHWTQSLTPQQFRQLGHTRIASPA